MTQPVLIIGGGLAGLFAALKLAPTPSIVLSPRPLGEGASSAWAQGGIAAAIAEGDTAEAHAADTVAAGAGLVDRDIALGLARDARARVEDLLAYGVPFDRDLEGHLVQSREAAHSSNRIVRVDGDRAGKAIMEALVAAVRAEPAITVLEGHVAEELVMSGKRVIGVIARDQGGAGERRFHQAGATILATGGLGALYAVTTNPPESRGIGLAIAAKAGARIADPEFVQFHPTAINIGRDPAPLATEALRGEGATIIDKDGVRFLVDGHPDAELAPRDVVARGVFASIASGKDAFLDCREAVGSAFPARFPTVYAACQAAGIDPVTQPIPIAPAEHYHMGGVWTDERGRTSLPGLWAAGEVASTGVHGANRLASNSLLEAVVFGARVAQDIKANPMPDAPDVPLGPSGRPGLPTKRDERAIALLRRTMQQDVGVIRSQRGLTRAIRQIELIRREAQSTMLVNMASAALCVAVAAALREESRGGHFRSDHPQANEELAHRTILTLPEIETVAESMGEAVAIAAKASPSPRLRGPRIASGARRS